MGEEEYDGETRGNFDDNILWEIWVAEPLTKDANLVIKFSRIPFFAGSPTCQPNIIDGKDFSLYHRCKDEAWARERFAHAGQFFRDVRIMVNGKQIEVAISSKDQTKPNEDILGNDPKLGSLGGC